MVREIHGAGLRLSLWLLDTTTNNVATMKPKQCFGELLSATGSFALNTVPTMTVSVPVGYRVNTERYKYPPFNWEEIESTVIPKRLPVGVCLTVSKNQAERQLGFLPKSSDGKSVRVCLFKGYIENVTYTRNGTTYSINLQLGHWLRDLSIFPLLNILSAPSNPADIASNLAFRPIPSDDPAREGVSSGVYNLLSGVQYTDVMYDNIAASIKKVMSYSDKVKLEHNMVGTQELYERVKNEFNTIQGSHTKLPDTLRLSDAIKLDLMKMLRGETASLYYSVTIWDKLVSTQLPKFYIALSPRVDACEAIPSPGMKMRKGYGTFIYTKEYTAATRTLVEAPTIGGIAVLTPSAVGPMAPPSDSLQISTYIWPQQSTYPGPIQVCELPHWLTLEGTVKTICGGTSTAASMSKFMSMSPEALNKLNNVSNETHGSIKSAESELSAFIQAYAKSAFQGHVFKQRQAVLSSPLRLNLTPGELICYELPKDDLKTPSSVKSDASQFIYATITSISYTISSTAASTTFALSNIRTESELEDPIYSSQDGLLYQDLWGSGDGITGSAYLWSDEESEEW